MINLKPSSNNVAYTSENCETKGFAEVFWMLDVIICDGIVMDSKVAEELSKHDDVGDSSAEKTSYAGCEHHGAERFVCCRHANAYAKDNDIET
jgi:hypothetical protein